MNKFSLRAYFKNDFPFFMALPTVVWQIFFFYVPVALIIVLSFLKLENGGVGVTVENYVHFMQPLFLVLILRSLLLALVTSLLCLLLAYPVAYCIAFNIRRHKNIFLYFLILPFWTSLMVQVYAWFFVLEHHGLINTFLLRIGLIKEPIQLLYNTFAIYTVMTYCYLPFMIMPVYTALEKIDRRLLEAAADLGATSWQAFLKITVPLSMPGIKTGFFLVFVPSFGEFVVPILLGGGKQLFVGSLISQYFLNAQNPHLGAAFTCISGIFLLAAVVFFYWYFARKTILMNKV